MKNEKWVIKPLKLGILLFILSFSPLLGEDDGEIRKPENGTYLLWSMGDLVKSRDPSTQKGEIIEQEWIYELIGGFVMNSSPVKRLRLTINFEIGTYNIYPRRPFGYDGEGTQDTEFATYIEETKGVFTFDNFDFEFGYFLNRYHKSARVFGEYMFRTMVYPANIFNGFDYTWYPLSGARFGNDLGENFHHDLYFLTEFDHYPYFDFSIAYNATFTLGSFLELGAGVNFKRIIPVRPSYTTPEVPSNTYVTIPAQGPGTYIDDTGAEPDTVTLDTIIAQSGFLDGTSRFAEVDGAYLNGDNELYPGIQHDRTVYSFQGIVPMGRLDFFPLGLMGESESAQMVSLYTETAVLGWKNYDGLYENRNERMPVMGGVQLAWPGIIDILAFEAEYFPSKIVPSYYWRGRSNLPLPGTKNPPSLSDAEGLAAEEERLSHDDWKWMIYARKSFTGIAFALQVGSDHMRRDMADFPKRYDEILTRPSHWYWQLRVRIPY